MSDNNADFNGAGQVNNPTSDNAAQADYNQPYIPQQNDAQMNHPESQPETPHTIRTPPHTLSPLSRPSLPFRRTIRTLPHTASMARPHSRPRSLSRHTVSRRLRPRHTVRLPSIPSRLSRPRPLVRYMIRTPHRTTSTVSMASRPSLPNLRSRRTVSRQPRRMTPTTLTPSRITTKRTTDSKATRPRLTTNPPIPSLPTRSSRHTASPSHRPDTPRSRNWPPVCLASSWAASACTTSTWATPARPWHSCC